MLDQRYALALSTFSRDVARLQQWLEESALPLWFKVGYDSDRGGFFERIELDGTPCRDDRRRARVHPRQIYCLAAAGMRGMPGDWLGLAQEGLTWFERVYRRHDGFFGAIASPAGEMIDDSFDLYNQAFAIFGYASLSAAIPERAAEFEAKAVGLLDGLCEVYRHPVAGFEEGTPVKLPLCSNPHMHLFEACLAWEKVAIDPSPWATLADEIASLVMSRFVDQRSGALREFFDHRWAPYPDEKGRVVEPGHQFEWSWLLARWGVARRNSLAIAIAERLFEIGAEHGICARRRVAVMGLLDDFSVHDSIARLWPQTEWLKASVLLAQIKKGDRRTYYLDQAAQAVQALNKFLATESPGVWYDKLTDSGDFINEPAPASSFYHILCAIYEVGDTLRTLQ